MGYLNPLVVLTVAFSIDIASIAQSTVPPDSDIILRSGQTFNLAHNTLHSRNDSVFLVLDGAGDLAVRKSCDHTTLWDLIIPEYTDSQDASMEPNGNFVIYGPNGRVNWETDTSGYPGADLRLQDDGFLCVFKSGHCLWSNDERFATTCAPTEPTEHFSVPDSSWVILQAGESKRPGQVVVQSLNSKVVLMFDVGNLVISRKCDNMILWTQRVSGVGRRLTMDLNGNFIVYGSYNQTEWESNTAGNAGADLRLEDDGFLCVYKSSMCVWSNGKRFETDCEPLSSSEATLMLDVVDPEIILRSGQSDTPGHVVLQSPNKTVALVFHIGDLAIERTCDNKVLWKQSVVGIARRIAMEPTGNLVVYQDLNEDGIANDIAWESGTGRNPGADLRLYDDGYLCVHKDGRCIWSSGNRFNPSCFTSKHRQATVNGSRPGSPSCFALLFFLLVFTGCCSISNN